MDGPLIIPITYTAKRREGEREGCISLAGRGADATHEASRVPACRLGVLPVATCHSPSARRNAPLLEGVPGKMDASDTSKEGGADGEYLYPRVNRRSGVLGYRDVPLGHLKASKTTKLFTDEMK
jgi:hypothetical protein